MARIFKRSKKQIFVGGGNLAVTKIWAVVKRVDHVVDYATNKEKTRIKMSPNGMYAKDLKDVIDYARNSDKTEEEYFVTGINLFNKTGTTAASPIFPTVSIAATLKRYTPLYKLV